MQDYLDELSALRIGNAASEASIQITAFRRWWNASLRALSTSDNSESDLYIAVFPIRASPGQRAKIVVPVASSLRLDELPPMTAAHAYGRLDVGAAVAIVVGDDLIFPIGPAEPSRWKTPKAV